MMSLRSSNYFKIDGTFRISFNHLWISISSFNEMLAFFVLHSTFDVGRSMFDVHLLICSMFIFFNPSGAKNNIALMGPSP